MKANTKMLLALAAGVAVVGAAGYFLTTDRGKKITKKWRKKGAGFLSQMEGLISEARTAVSDLKMAGCAGARSETREGASHVSS